MIMKKVQLGIISGSLSLIFIFLLTPLSLWAIEYPEESVAKEQQNVVYQDKSTKKIQDMSEVGEPPYEPVKTAESLVDDYLKDNDIRLSWNDDKKIFVAVGEAFFDSEDPSYDDSFITKRSLKSMDAMLQAKAKIIEYIRTSMSAMDKAVTPGTDIHAKFKEDIEKAQKRMEAQKNKLAKLLEQVDQSEAETLRGATFGDRLNAAMDASIKKLDKEYSVKQIEEKKQKKYEKYKERYAESLVEYTNLRKKIEATKGNLKEKSESNIDTIASMPLFGAITVAQFESWNEEEEQYEVALVVLWSSKMERLARAFITGEKFPIPPGEKTVGEWIDSQNWSSSTGGRRFRDNTGNVYFIGIGTSAIGSSSSSRRRAMGVAEMMAKKEVAMSIFADVDSHKNASQLMEVRSGGASKDSSHAAETFASELQQSIENRQIHGLQELYGKELVHPISNQKIYVSIYGISGNSVRQALLMQDGNYLTKILDIKSQQKMKGRTDAYKSKIQEEQSNRSEYNQSKLSTSKNIDNSIMKDEESQQRLNEKQKSTDYNYSSDSNKGGKSRAGAYSGGGNSKLNKW